MIILDLIYKLALLVAFSAISIFITTKFNKEQLTGKIFQGLLFGVAACIGMFNPFILEEGIIFDGRSIVISLCTLFFGPVSGGITAIMAIVFRNVLGGSGTLMGTMVIISSFLIGYYFHFKRSKENQKIFSGLSLYLFGIWVHLAMLLLIFTLPGKYILEVYKVVALTIIGIYPIISLFIGKILQNDERIKLYINQIKERESLYRTTLYSIGEAVITTDMDGRVQQMNQHAEELTGWKESEARLKTLEEVFIILNEYDRVRINNHIEKLTCESIGSLRGDNILLTERNGKEISIAFNGSPITSENGDMTGIILVFRDQTEERKIQRALIESEERYRKLLESAPIGIAVHVDNYISYINPTGATLLGADSTGRIIGKHLQSIVHPICLQESLEHSQRILNGEKLPDPIENVYVKIDGSSIDVEVMATIITHRGKPAVQFIYNDITQRKRAENEIKRLNSDLERIVEERTSQLMETNKELEAYTYSVSHDLRAPLRAIDGFARFLIEDYSKVLDAPGKEIVQVIRQNSKRMGRLIDDLLVFSKLSYSQMNFSNVKMNPVVNEVFMELAALNPEKRIDFHCDILDDARGDESMTRQVWINLISNSIKYSLPRDITIISVSSIRENDEIIYCIQDNGIGFDMEHVDKLFGVFRRLHSIKEYDGTGVGLAIVKRIINRQRGKVWAKGEIDKGAMFYFSLPVAT